MGCGGEEELVDRDALAADEEFAGWVMIFAEDGADGLHAIWWRGKLAERGQGESGEREEILNFKLEENCVLSCARFMGKGEH